MIQSHVTNRFAFTSLIGIFFLYSRRASKLSKFNPNSSLTFFGSVSIAHLRNNALMLIGALPATLNGEMFTTNSLAVHSSNLDSNYLT